MQHACLFNQPVHQLSDPNGDSVMNPTVPESGFTTSPKLAECGGGPIAAVTNPSAGTTQSSRDEVLGVLNELLEAERAGARVAMDTAREMPPSALATLVQDIHKDEVRWCSMLMRTIKDLQGTPSSATGAFWGKAMAIPDLEQRLSFLNRGQAWVVRRLTALMPKIQDAQVRADLAEMLEAHHKNIERVEARTSIGPSAGPG
jgi:nitronate monooxygenase